MFLRTFLFLLSLTGILFPQKSPENIIIFIGDGMGLTYVSANVIMDKDNPFQKFTSFGLSLTSSADHLITDSGAGATAISTGHRTKNLAIGVDTLQRPLITILELAKKLNKSTGIIATSSVTNATPAAFLAHQPQRKMENEIAHDIYLSGADVVIGGGSSYFSSSENNGRRGKGDHLPDSLTSKGYLYYTQYDQFINSKPDKPFYALLEPDALKPAGERKYSLADLVSKALEYLSKDEDGFVLMIEGSQIDWAAHDHKTGQLFKEMEDFSGALNKALQFAGKENNTLVLVTSDHETSGGAITGGKLNGKDLEINYASSNHTGTMVGIFTKGAGEEHFRGIMPNYLIGRKLFKLLDPDFNFDQK
jgi:alkaline phosphatase